MKLSKFNYYLQHDNYVFVFNTLSEKITRIPISAIDLEHQTIEMASEELISTLQELAMVYEDDIDENRVYNFWIKRQVHDESCFRVNIYLANEKYNDSSLLEIKHPDECGADNKKRTIIEQIISLSSMLSSYSMEMNLIICEKANNIFLNDIQSFVNIHKEQFAQIRVNIIFNTSYVDNCTLKLLQELGLDNAFLEVMSELGVKKVKGLPITFLKNVFATDNTSPEIHIIVGPDHLGAYNELSLIPIELRDKVQVHFCTCPQIYVNYESFLLSLHKNLEHFYSAITSITQLGYRINPIEMVQFPCSEVTDSCISLLPNGDICKCIFSPRRVTKVEDGVDITSQLYQYVLSQGADVGNKKECVDCVFAPWCARRCLIKCAYSSMPIRTCPKDIYEQLSKRIIAIWRKIDNETT